MQKIILEKLNEIEQHKNVRILYAVESGSRAWGFESPDSDYDVRFIYVRPLEDYLKISSTSDVIEWQLDETLDINGWDLKKAFGLLIKSNPTLFEWANSPIVYKTTPEWDKIKAIVPSYFISKNGLYHYLHMAEGNYREYLKTDMVRVKKYLYVLRPILACKWILQNNTPPPMLFADLINSQLDDKIKPTVKELLQIKMNSPETELMPRIELLNDYIDVNIAEIKARIEELPPVPKADIEELNKLFIEILKGA